MKRAAWTLILLSVTACFAPVAGQKYPFIRYDGNRLEYARQSPSLGLFLSRWRQLEATGQGNLNIVHIGGSHVQAGTMSNAIRQHLMHAYPALVSGRGMLFPYSAAARCNNPADYAVHCPQKVVLTRNVYQDHPQPLGLCGISVTAADSLTEVGIVLRDTTVDYATTRIVAIGRSDQGVTPMLSLDGRLVFPSYVDPRTDRFVFNLAAAVDSFTLVLPCRAGESFTLTGLYLGNRRPGFSFHSVGANGASVPDYLRCPHLARDLRLLHPDMVLFGLGINDASKAGFDTAEFRRHYLELIDSVRAVNPDCALVFITNNDSFKRLRRNRYEVNANGALAREVFHRLARETGGVVWDQFAIMGGLRSMDRWRQAGLAQTDRVHFTRAGYQLLGDLFWEALLDAYRKHNPAPSRKTP